MNNQAKTLANVQFVPIMLVLMLAVSITGAAAPFCNTCEHPVIMLEVVGGLWPGQVNLTATLFTINAPESDSTNFLIGSIQSGKVSVDKLKDMAEVTFLKDKNLTVYYNYTDAGGTSREIVLCPDQKTNATGSIACSATISQSGCGTIVVEYVSDDPSLISTETSASHCVRGEIPFGIVVDQGVCLTMFLVLGILIASLYASGKSPLATLDITTPKKPSGYGYWPGFLSSKYKIAGIAKKRAALSAVALGTSLMMDKAITKKQLVKMSLTKNLGGDYTSFLKVAIKTNPDRVNQVNLISTRLNKLYAVAGTHNVWMGPRTPAERKKSMDIAREITSLENERNRKISIINQVGAAMKARLVPVDMDTAKFNKIEELSAAAKKYAAAELANGGDATMIFNSKMKELAAAAVIANLAKDNPHLAVLEDIKANVARLKSQGKTTIQISRDKFEDLESGESIALLKEMGEPTYPGQIKGTEKNVKVNISDLEKMIQDREKEINKLKGGSDSHIDIFTPLLASEWKTELAEKGLMKELEAERRKPSASQDSERKEFIEKNIEEMRSERQRIQGLKKSIAIEISSTDARLMDAGKIEKLYKKVKNLDENIDKIKEDIRYRKLESKDHEREISKLEKKGALEEDLRVKREVLDSEISYLDRMKKELDAEKDALKATKKEYNSAYEKWVPPGMPHIPGTEAVIGKILETPLFPMVKAEKEKAFGYFLSYERKELGARLADSLVTKGAIEAIRTAGMIEAAKLRLGVDLEREGSA